MRLYLEFIEGPLAGKKVSINEKTSLGRGASDLLVADPKLSGVHAFFEYSKAEGWIILDNQSRNGVWVNGHKELKAILKEGDLIQMGASKILCRLLGLDQPLVSEKFQNWVGNLVKKIKNKQNTMIEIKPELRLKAIQGVQFGQTWDIFYGPRRAGRESIDICLFDEKAPKESFEILVKGKYAYFQTDQEKVVQLNKKSIKSKQLEPGDVISFGESQLLVEFDEGHGFSS